LDVGTNCQVLIDDPSYHGWCHSFLRGEENLKFVEEFVEAVKDVFGKTILIQWEDFEIDTVFKLLDYFRLKCYCFNDDIEGTSSVVAATLATATLIKGVPALSEQKILFMESGSAGTRIANLIPVWTSSQTHHPSSQDRFHYRDHMSIQLFPSSSPGGQGPGDQFLAERQRCRRDIFGAPANR
jgi:malate dehydrogenase (oxaloacetate-decarboxylating)/malate dehydrogenase (oxaloacetate-decarboxylating)(NADP+)